jgi:hypothetical protein
LTWYVTCSPHAESPDDYNVWTLSQDPNETGWETDCGQDSYGLPKATATMLAAYANSAEAWNKLQYRAAPGPRKQHEPVIRECAVCHKLYTVNWQRLSAIRCDECAPNLRIPVGAEELEEVRRLIRMHWKVIETPPMSDIDCIKFAKQIVDQICQGTHSNQFDEVRLLHWVNVGVINSMNIVHGGRGVLVQMLKDALDATQDHFPAKDREGDTHGAPSIY